MLDWVDAGLHVVIVALAVTVLTVSILAYWRKRSARYFLLSLGFFFLFLSQLATLYEVLFLSDALIMIPAIGLHLNHIFDLFTLVFFLLAVSGYGQGASKWRPFANPGAGFGKTGPGVSNALCDAPVDPSV
jgi:hypothetical protein